jgi:hypothetical protein
MLNNCPKNMAECWTSEGQEEGTMSLQNIGQKDGQIFDKIMAIYWTDGCQNI